MMTFSAAFASIKARLRERWQATPIREGWQPSSEPDPPEPFVKVHAAGWRGRSIEIGNPAGRSIEYGGTAKLVLFVPTEAGDALALDYADALSGILSGAEIGAGAERVVCGMVDIGPPTPADDARRWRSLTITVPFTFFGRGATP